MPSPSLSIKLETFTQRDRIYMDSTKDTAIHIKYFAELHEFTQKRAEIWHLNAPKCTAKDLYSQLRQKYGFLIPFDELQIAINDEFADKNQYIYPGDQVAFLPPVAGG